ncbi:MAG: aminotransferase class V-fold PLP-dependent enzyme [Candidatus Acidiferrales bacterium]
MRRIYLDNNATTPVDPAVLEAILPFFAQEYGNASSIHGFGQKCRAAVEQARDEVAGLLNARASEIVFTSGGTESNNQAIFGVVNAAPGPRKHVVTTTVEHSAVLQPCEELERRGVEVTYVAASREGRVDPEMIRQAIRSETVLISVMMANNEIGTIEPVEAIAAIAAEKGIAFHVDAVQAAGKIPVDVKSIGAPLLSISGHKLYAPKGVGALYVRDGTRLDALLFGGRHGRDGRPGTENVPGIVGLGKAAEIARRGLAETNPRVAALRDRFERGLLLAVPIVRINGSCAARTPNTSNLVFSHIEAEAMVIALDLQGIACSAGAACSSGTIEPSHVLTAIGLNRADARASVRFSLGRCTTEAEIDHVLDVIPRTVQRLRSLSPTWREAVVA